MTDLVVSDGLNTQRKESLSRQRRELRDKERRWKHVRHCWQFVGVCGLAGGMVWVMGWPQWALRSPQQVEFKGNQLVDASTLKKALPLTYPQSLWQVSTQDLSQQMGTHPALLQAVITRRVFPTQLQVQVTERQPLAIAVGDKGLGYLDAQGQYIPATVYSKATQKRLPQTPQFLGYAPQYQAFWQTHHAKIQQSPLKIRIINGQNPSNITLTTAMGLVILGSNLDQFDRQLTVLEKMRQLPRHIPQDRLAFIDLTNPDDPRIQLKPQPRPPAKSVTKP